MNLAEFVLDPFTPNAKFDFEGFKEAVGICVRGLNEVLEEGMMRPLSTAILLEQQEGDTGSASSLINFSNTMLGCIGMIISGFRFFGDIRTLAAILIVFTAAGVVIFAVLMRSDIEIKHLK
jgi:hypothetical protein